MLFRKSAIGLPFVAVYFLSGFLGGGLKAASIPTGWACSGNCGALGANGVVTLSPAHKFEYQWVSTFNGINGVGALPGVGGIGSPADGSTLSTSPFTANTGAVLQFYFNYVTSDGSGFSDYAWGRLLNATGQPLTILFTARTSPTASVVPGFAMPPPASTISPANVPIIAGAPAWSPLGDDSGECYARGCGYTGWVESTYKIQAGGTYILQIGVTNWDDPFFQSGLALDGIVVGGKPIPPIPEPASAMLFGLGVASLWAVRKLKHNR